MTDRQREVLSFISGHLRWHGVPPTMEEIAEALGLTHRSTAHSHCKALLRDGHLEARQVRGVTCYYPAEQDPAAA